MATLADIASGPLDDRGAYLAYREACDEAGKTPLPYPAWVAAGKPRA
jgi:hypothetical protein